MMMVTISGLSAMGAVIAGGIVSQSMHDGEVQPCDGELVQCLLNNLKGGGGNRGVRNW